MKWGNGYEVILGTLSLFSILPLYLAQQICKQQQCWTPSTASLEQESGCSSVRDDPAALEHEVQELEPFAPQLRPLRIFASTGSSTREKANVTQKWKTATETSSPFKAELMKFNKKLKKSKSRKRQILEETSKPNKKGETSRPVGPPCNSES